MTLFAELKRRNVFRVGIAYIVVAWLAIQIADVMIDNIGAPDWLFGAVLMLLAIGLPVALVFAWAFELTPEGIKKEKDVDRNQSITPRTGRKLDFLIIGVLAVALAYFVWESRFAAEKASEKEALTSPATPAATAEAVEKSIAVLPFANRSRLEDDEFFTDGIHDDLLTQLTKIGGLKVIARTSMMKYRNTEMTIPEIAGDLGVTTILEGGVQRAGKRIRINAQLIDVASDGHLWAETFDRQMSVENIFDIQSEITRQIVSAVRGELTPEENRGLAQVPTDSLEAYEHFLRARATVNRTSYSPEAYLLADEWLGKALEADSGFALAWALRVELYGGLIWFAHDESPQMLDKTAQALAMAERLGPHLPETLTAKASFKYRVETDFRAAQALLERAHAAKPGDSDILESLATVERRTGKFDRSIEHFRRVVELDPANVQARDSLVGTLQADRQLAASRQVLNRWLIDQPESSLARILLANNRMLQSDLEGARTQFDQVEPWSSNLYEFYAAQLLLWERDYQGVIDVLKSRPDERASSGWERIFLPRMIGQAYGLMGDVESARRWNDQAIAAGKARVPSNANSKAWALESMAHVYANNNQMDRALAAAEEAVALKPESGDSIEGPYMAAARALMLGKAGRRDEALREIERLLHVPAGIQVAALHYSPDWDFFRDDPRFNALATPQVPGQGSE